METRKKLWYFDEFNLLDSMSPQEKMEIAKQAGMKESNKKEVVYFSDDSADKVYFLKHGKVKISRYSQEGKEMILSVLGPGELFGGLGMSEGSSHGEVAEVMEDAIICSLSVQQLKMMLEKNPEFNLSVTKLIGLRFKKIQSRLEALCFKSAPERIRGFVKEMTDDYGRILANGSEYEVKLKLTHEDIAKLTATTRQSVTTELSHMEKEGIILYDRKRILVKDYKGLT